MAAVDRDRRPIRNECRNRRPIQYPGERWPVEAHRITGEPMRLALPDAPRRMRHMIFLGAAVALPRIRPVMLGDELIERTRLHRLGLAGKLGGRFELAARPTPLVAHVAHSGSGQSKLMPHRAVTVLLVVHGPGDQADGSM